MFDQLRDWFSELVFGTGLRDWFASRLESLGPEPQAWSGVLDQVCDLVFDDWDQSVEGVHQNQEVAKVSNFVRT